jgi:hypothetical protein
MLVDIFSIQKPSEQMYQNLLLSMTKKRKCREEERRLVGLQLVVLTGIICTNYPIRLYSLQTIAKYQSMSFWRQSIAFVVVDFTAKCILEQIQKITMIPWIDKMYFGYEWYRYTILTFVGNHFYHFQIIQPWALLYLIDSVVQNKVHFLTKSILDRLLPKSTSLQPVSFYPSCVCDYVAMTIAYLFTLPVECILTTLIIQSHVGCTLYIASFDMEFWSLVGTAAINEFCCRFVSGIAIMEAAWLFLSLI